MRVASDKLLGNVRTQCCVARLGLPRAQVIITHRDRGKETQAQASHGRAYVKINLGNNASL